MLNSKKHAASSSVRQNMEANASVQGVLSSSSSEVANQNKHSSEKITPTSTKTSNTKITSAEAKSGHKPKMRQTVNGKEDTEDPKKDPYSHSNLLGNPRKINFDLNKDDAKLVPENATNLKDTSCSSILGEEKTSMAIDNC
ncbi:unnamed protein product [Linum trigynum]|uniref:Uncharacterized protein n=1 Tax=Linum trigynum TaxID=586398 RepID=A0AAV2CTZ4_9ROSI